MEYVLILQKDAAPGAKNYFCVVVDWVRKNKSMLELFSPALAILVLVMNKKLHSSVSSRDLNLKQKIPNSARCCQSPQLGAPRDELETSGLSADAGGSRVAPVPPAGDSPGDLGAGRRAVTGVLGGCFVTIPIVLLVLGFSVACESHRSRPKQ